MSDPVPDPLPQSDPFKPIVKPPETKTYWRCAACEASTPHHRVYCDRCGENRPAP